MFGKSGFVLRALFVTFTVGSLVACTFEEGTDEEERGHTSSKVDRDEDEDAEEGAARSRSDGGSADASVDHWATDGGPYVTDGGMWGDGGAGSDGGAWGGDGGAGSDGGAWFDGGGWADGGGF